MNLKEFLESKGRNSYIEEDNYTLYVRKGHHLIGDKFNTKIEKTFDIGNITAFLPEQGRLKPFLAYLEKIIYPQYKILYIENILTRRFEEFFIRLKYKKAPIDGIIPSYYKIIGK